MITNSLSADSFDLLSSLGFVLLATGLFLVVYLLCMCLSTRGYDRQFFEENVMNGEAALNENYINILLSDGRNKKTIDISERFSFVPKFWDNMLPEQKAQTVFNTLFCLVMTVALFRLSRTSDSDNSMLINYVLRGDWEKGLNPFAFFSIFIVICVTLMLMTAIKNIILMISLPLDTKGETICRMIYNLTKYVAIICILYFSFGSLGFDTRGILVSIGFVTLAISLGSKDLVANIVAGLTIIFEGDYQVGDMIEVDGYRGQVQEIGVRSTKILGRGNNVKIIDNRDVRNVLNLTRLNSWIPIEVSIPSSQPLSVDHTITASSDSITTAALSRS